MFVSFPEQLRLSWSRLAVLQHTWIARAQELFLLLVADTADEASNKARLTAVRVGIE